ncbi:DUF4105 domain-containing protein [uncultured Jannaschia sp.]|uniref:Lnb N-terminal periplasmic domain-containing protein n=1 Tax=uncultured Jannaschia sp. TaxID=293347 RepID=UPI00262F446D|nr:DUF4105 domain-containing protein [uncultured Jannaschia sp.]
MRRLSAALLAVALILLMVWTITAVAFQIDRPLWPIVGAVLGVAVAAVSAVARCDLRLGWLALIVCLAAIVLWWSAIVPRQDRVWAPDVAYNVTAEIGSDVATVHNIRDFDWHSEDSATVRWTSGVYPLDAITSVDLVTSVWDSPAIAHVLVSFGFADGRHLAFSAEIRREADETFSSIGGFFKEFELALVAAKESDILKLRTNIRREDVSLFPLRLAPPQARRLFVSYLERGNELAKAPEFYNTITANCTTIAFRLARLVEGGLPLDWRILLSGYLPSYLYDLGILKTDLPLEETLRRARITERAQMLSESADYSLGIRRDRF